MSKRREPKNGMPPPSTCARSITSPVLISVMASSTTCGFMRLPEPRSSPTPHFDGQRALSGGTAQDGVCARETVLAISAALKEAANAMHFIGFPPGDIYYPECRSVPQHAPAA